MVADLRSVIVKPRGIGGALSGHYGVCLRRHYELITDKRWKRATAGRLRLRLLQCPCLGLAACYFPYPPSTRVTFQ